MHFSSGLTFALMLTVFCRHQKPYILQQFYMHFRQFRTKIFHLMVVQMSEYANVVSLPAELSQQIILLPAICENYFSIQVRLFQPGIGCHVSGTNKWVSRLALWNILLTAESVLSCENCWFFHSYSITLRQFSTIKVIMGWDKNVVLQRNSCFFCGLWLKFCSLVHSRQSPKLINANGIYKLRTLSWAPLLWGFAIIPAMSIVLASTVRLLLPLLYMLLCKKFLVDAL